MNQANQSQIADNWFNKQQGESSAEQSLHTFLHIVVHYRWSILLLFIIGCIAGVFKAVSEQPIYRASLSLVVEPSSRRYMTSQQSLLDPYGWRFYETQYELIKSRSVAEKVVDSLSLVDKDVDKVLVPPGFSSKLRSMLSSLPLLGFLKPEVTVTENVTKVVTEEDRERKRKWLTSVVQSGVIVKGTEKSQLVIVSYISKDPYFAAEVANALVDSYIQLGLESQLDRTQQTSIWLSKRLESLKQNLLAAQKNLQEYLAREDMLDSSRTKEITTSKLTALNNEYILARSRYDELTKRYGDKHPKLTESRAEMLAAKKRLENVSKSVGADKPKEFELSTLEKEVQANQELYDVFLAKFRETDLSTGAQISSARVIDKALPPGGPIHPNKQKIMITWGLGGLILGILLAFLREQLDSTFRNPRSLEEKLHLPVLGIVELLDTAATFVERKYIQSLSSVFAESINRIRTSIIYSDVDHPPQVILLTSSAQGEGKTTIASNLALSYSQLGPTLLIDADLRRPRIKHLINSQNSAGLVDYVAGQKSLKSCLIQDKEEKNLFILNCGTPPPNPLELLSSEKLHNTIDRLREKFSYIIIDTAPVLPASDATVLGQISDALIMVVQSEKTTHHMAREAIKRLNAVNVSVTGLVLSQADINKMQAYKYGGYGYGYGYYGGYYAEDDAK